jgi:transcriptional regulator with XRE-family HTH domain
MKLKKFDDYLKKRLDPNETIDLERQAEIEMKFIKALQDDVSRIVTEYMAENKIGFNELVRRLDANPYQVSKIQKGEANLTLASLAHLAALFNKQPHIVFENCKTIQS